MPLTPAVLSWTHGTAEASNWITANLLDKVKYIYFKLCILFFQGQLNSWLEVNMRTTTAIGACAVWSELAGKDQSKEPGLQEICCVDLKLFWRNLSHKCVRSIQTLAPWLILFHASTQIKFDHFRKGERKNVLWKSQYGSCLFLTLFSPENGPFQQKINHPHYRRRPRLVHLLKCANTA